MELEHLTIGELQQTIHTLESGHLVVGRKMRAARAALEHILENELATLDADVDPTTTFLSHQAISDLDEPMEIVRTAIARIEARA